jgi:hypothetical protein
VSDAVEILIQADDQASGKLNKVADNVDSQVKRIKEVGGRAKASTEFIGTLANSLGGSELASYAGGLAQLTERISAFSEVSKAGGAGAAAFKLGLAGVVAVGAFKAGQAIGNLVFETKRWSEELERAELTSAKLFDQASQLRDFRFGTDMEGLSLIRDPEEQTAEAKRLRDGIEKEIIGLQATIKQTQDLEKDSNYAWFATAQERALDKKSIEDAEKQIEQLRQQRTAIDQTTDARRKELEAIRESQALADRNAGYIESLQGEVELLNASSKAHEARKQSASIDTEMEGLAQRKAGGENVDAEIEALARKKAAVEATADSERRAIEAQQRAGGDVEAAKKIESLMHQRDLIEATREAEKQAADQVKKASEEQIQASERIADLKQKESDRIKEQILLVTQGKEAAKAFALEQQGLDRESAKRLAAQQAMADELGKKLESDEPQQAVQGRLLTRGRTDDTAKKQLEVAMQMKKALDIIAANTEQTDDSGLVIEVSGS